MKVALVHEWLTNMAGSEKVLKAFLDLFPAAHIYTSVYDRERMPAFAGADVRTSFLQRIPGSRRHYQKLLPLMPLAFEQFALEDYDLVLSSSHACAKGVITRPDTLHICYCHTPMRYAWDFYHHYVAGEKSPLAQLLIPPVMSYLRLWDLAAANRVDHFIANSTTVARRIWKHYRREAAVIHPPVDVEEIQPSAEVDDYFLVVSRLVSYKRIDLAVAAFNSMGLPLVIIGDGPERRALEKMAGANIRFLGYQPDSVIREHYARCQAFVFPGEEDFGITPVEAQAAGRPVLAFGRGGVLDSVVPGETGLFFPEQSAKALIDAVRDFQRTSFDSKVIRRNAERFSRTRFLDRMRDFIKDALHSG